MFGKKTVFFREQAQQKAGKLFSGSVEYLIAGLGNPGKEYENTRHNTGFMALDRLAEKYGVNVTQLKFQSLCAAAVIGGKKVLLLKPQTFMNNSGEAIAAAARFYKIPPEKVFVLFDDISLPPSRVRVRRRGSDGGHNGIKSIIAHLGSDAFPRVKLGVGAKPNPEYDLAAWVLGKFKKEDAELMQQAFEKTIGAVELMLDGNFEEAMSRYNG